MTAPVTLSKRWLLATAAVVAVALPACVSSYRYHTYLWDFGSPNPHLEQTEILPDYQPVEAVEQGRHYRYPNEVPDDADGYRVVGSDEVVVEPEGREIPPTPRPLEPAEGGAALEWAEERLEEDLEELPATDGVSE